VKNPPTEHKCSHQLAISLQPQLTPTQQTQRPTTRIPPPNKVPEIHSALAFAFAACPLYLTQSSSPLAMETDQDANTTMLANI